MVALEASNTFGLGYPQNYSACASADTPSDNWRVVPQADRRSGIAGTCRGRGAREHPRVSFSGTRCNVAQLLDGIPGALAR